VRAEQEGPITLFTRHVVVPAAIIAMVTAFLFYLLEVRSLYLGATHAFKQVGLCFAAATVLIARYGRINPGSGAVPRGDPSISPRKDPFAALGEINDNQGCYTLVLGLVTLAFMLQRSSGVSLIPNVLIVGAVWRFATGVTRALSLEGDLESQPKQRRLYGLERLRLERFQARMREERGPAWGGRVRPERGPEGPDSHGNPVAAVARLAALALLVFALGEPFLLGGPPDVAERALAAVIVFLFSTGLVLAAGSAAGTLRHTVRSGGRVSPSVLPARLGVAALLSVAVLAAALAIPGLQFKGQGRPRAMNLAGKTGSGDGQTDGRQSSQARPDAEEGAARPDRKGDEPDGGEGRDDAADSGPVNPAGAGLVQALGSLGKLLRIPFLLGILLALLLALRKLRPYLPSGSDLLARLRAWLSRFRRERIPPPPPVVDPFADLGALAALPPRDAVLAAYHRLLAALEQAGHPRPQRTTPYEHLNGLPPRLKPIAAAAQTLTELYVLSAYGDSEATEGDRDRALAALAGMQALARG
jgi:hypothetical protein